MRRQSSRASRARRRACATIMTPSASPPPSNASAGVSLRDPLIFYTDTRGRCWRLEKLAYRTPLEAREEHELRQAA